MSMKSERDRVFFRNILRTITSQEVYILGKVWQTRKVHGKTCFHEKLFPVKILRLVQSKLRFSRHDCVVQLCSDGISRWSSMKYSRTRPKCKVTSFTKELSLFYTDFFSLLFVFVAFDTRQPQAYFCEPLLFSAEYAIADGFAVSHYGTMTITGTL